MHGTVSKMTLPLLILISGYSHAADMLFKGALVAEPCVVSPDDDDINVDFGSVVEKYLYANHRTAPKSFEIRLSGCSTDIAKSVSVTFNGMESNDLPGLLALDSVSAAKGIAIGMETAQAQLLPVNKPGADSMLADGDNIIPLQAFIQAVPSALANNGILSGSFTATATFSLNYQ